MMYTIKWKKTEEQLEDLKPLEEALSEENNNKEDNNKEDNNIEIESEEAAYYRAMAKSYEEKYKEKRNIFLATGFIMLAIIAIAVLVGLGWFVVNNRTDGVTGGISAKDDVTFSLATLRDGTSQGIYDENQQESTTSPLAKALNKFFRADKNGRGDNQGNHYTTFLDLPSLKVGTSIFTDKDGKEYILGDSDGISLMVNAESNVNNTTQFEHIGPGSFGKFTFYIIPHLDNFQEVTLSVSLKPYTLIREGEADNSGKTATGRAKQIEKNGNNTALLNMLQGHILLFTAKDENGNYANRVLPNLKEDGTVCFTFKKDSQAGWIKDQPEPITIYWIWPKRFENIKYYGHEDSVFKSSCSSYTELLEWINTNRNYIVNIKNEQDITSLADPKEDMTNRQFARWTVGYNKGDQLIGDNIAFFQWVIDAQ